MYLTTYIYFGKVWAPLMNFKSCLMTCFRSARVETFPWVLLMNPHFILLSQLNMENKSIKSHVYKLIKTDGFVYY